MRRIGFMVACALAICLVPGGTAPAQTDIRKCVDAQGNVTFTDRPCTANAVQQDAGLEKRNVPAAEPAVRPARDEKLARQITAMQEALEAKRLDLESKCKRGDSKACADAICMRLHTDGMEASRIRACSDANGFKHNDRWAQMSKVHTHDRGNYLEITCLSTPQVLKSGGKEIRIFRQIRLSSENRATGFHDRNRYYTNILGGPDYASWEAAADATCAP